MQSAFGESTNDDACKRLHQELGLLKVVKWPFDLEDLPENGVYFFYEEGESWGHGGEEPRIVRIGTHKEGNFKSRVREHYVFDEGKLDFNKDQPAPKERSIFRKNIGRALLAKEKDNYLKVWEIDYTTKENRKKFGELRNIEKEKDLEKRISRILRERFSFKYITVNGERDRMGSSGIESELIGTVSRCRKCRPSKDWLGLYSPKKGIRNSGMWLVQHLGSSPLDRAGWESVCAAIKRTEM
ncbi:MAG: hypothetical protein LVQ95_05305 [Candidatus Micrarchaeales archaeon]|nr:hypothetical protein [Candidatus Micrarchaeales archaeon]